jgi:hypothetical protein
MSETDYSDLQTLAGNVSNLGSLQDKQKILQEQLQRARMLQSTEMPRGRMVGRMYVPSSWTQGLDSMAGQMMGGAQAGAVGNNMESNLRNQTQGRGAYALEHLKQQQQIADLLRMLRPAQPQSQSTVSSTPGLENQ